jgi:hypothetical protein
MTASSALTTNDTITASFTWGNGFKWNQATATSTFTLTLTSGSP